jgi:hypothetical protein
MEPTSLTLSFVLSLFLGPASSTTSPEEPGFFQQVEDFAVLVLADPNSAEDPPGRDAASRDVQPAGSRVGRGSNDG